MSNASYPREVLPVAVRFLLTLALLAFIQVDVAAGLPQQETLADAARLSEETQSLFAQRRFAEAIPKAEKAAEAWKHLRGEKEDYATSLNSLGALYQMVGQYDKAESAYERALEVGNREAILLSSLRSLNNLGGLYYVMGRYDKSGTEFQQALQIEENVINQIPQELFAKKPPRLITLMAYYGATVHGLAVVDDTTGEYQKAESLYEEAVRIQKELKEVTEPNGESNRAYAQTLNDLGWLYYIEGHYDKAQYNYKQALEIREKTLGETHPDCAQTLNNLGLLYVAMGQYADAETSYTQARDIAKQSLGENHASYARTLLNLAALYHLTRRELKSVATLDDAMNVEQRNLNAVFGFAAESTMQAYLESIRPSLDVLLGMVISEAPGNRDPAIRTAVNQAAARWILRRKAMVFDALSRLRQAEQLRENDPTVAQKAQRVRELKQRLHDLAFSPPRNAEATSLDRERNATRTELERVEADLSRTLASQSSSQLGETIDTDRVQRHLLAGEGLIEFLRAYAYDFQAKPAGSGFARYFVLVLCGGQMAVPRLIDLGEAGEIDRKVKDAREKMTEFEKLVENGAVQSERTEEDTFRSISAELYRAIFTSKVKQALGSVNTLYVAPDGQLNQIAFESLVDETGKYLVENCRLVYLTAGRDLLRRRTEIGKGTVVFAAPDYNLGVKEREGQAKALVARLEPKLAPRMHGVPLRDIRGLQWDPLKGAAQEARDIHRLLDNSQFGPVTGYEGPEAVEEIFLGLHSPRLLHVATHGYFLPDQEIAPEDRENLAVLDESSESGAARGLARLHGVEDPLLRSGLVFAGANLVGSSQGRRDKVGDGWVTAQEISLMDLRGTELVVLSACESGLGAVRAGDGVQGLRRAFLLAGARSLVMSLYKVPDVESAQLMQQFYRNLKAGKDKASAMQDAELQMMHERRKNGAAHPFFWASFIFLGDPN